MQIAALEAAEKFKGPDMEGELADVPTLEVDEGWEQSSTSRRKKKTK